MEGDQYFEQCGCLPTDSLEVLKEKLLWGTYGPPGAKHSLKWVLLKDCSSDHLTNILIERLVFGMPLTAQIVDVIEALLHERGYPIPGIWTFSPTRLASLTVRCY